MDEESYINSLKADIIPIINAELHMAEDRLYLLSIDALNELFNVIHTKTIPPAKLREIITNNSTSEAILDAIKKTIHTPSPGEIPIASSSVSSPVPDTIFSQDSIKQDIIPVIQNMIDVTSEKLFSLSIDTLNHIYSSLESGIVPASEIESIILSTQDSGEIIAKLQEKISNTAQSSDTYREDLIIGILFNLPENIRPQIEPKLREIEDLEELAELSQLDPHQLQSKLGIEPIESTMDIESVQSPLGLEGPLSQRYDERLDLIAGILAQLPPSLQGIIGDRLKEIQDIDQLVKLSQLNYVQVQQELGLAAQSPSDIPANILNPVDTASRPPMNLSGTAFLQEANSSSSPSTPESASADIPPQSPQLQAQIQQRREANNKYVTIIQKMAEKIWKVKITEADVQTPEGAALKEKIEILLRIHPARVEKIFDQLKNAKDKKRFKALFDWYVYSQRIEEIETYVEHWQGQVQGIGGFRAAINVSRFDPIVEHLPTKEIEGIIVNAKNALERIHNSNINIRARGVEDIKQISNYLLQKAR